QCCSRCVRPYAAQFVPSASSESAASSIARGRPAAGSAATASRSAAARRSPTRRLAIGMLPRAAAGRGYRAAGRESPGASASAGALLDEVLLLRLDQAEAHGLVRDGGGTACLAPVLPGAVAEAAEREELLRGAALRRHARLRRRAGAAVVV